MILCSHHSTMSDMHQDVVQHKKWVGDQQQAYIWVTDFVPMQGCMCWIAAAVCQCSFCVQFNLISNNLLDHCTQIGFEQRRVVCDTSGKSEACPYSHCSVIDFADISCPPADSTTRLMILCDRTHSTKACQVTMACKHGLNLQRSMR